MCLFGNTFFLIFLQSSIRNAPRINTIPYRMDECLGTSKLLFHSFPFVQPPLLRTITNLLIAYTWSDSPNGEVIDFLFCNHISPLSVILCHVFLVSSPNCACNGSTSISMFLLAFCVIQNRHLISLWREIQSTSKIINARCHTEKRGLGNKSKLAAISITSPDLFALKQQTRRHWNY